MAIADVLAMTSRDEFTHGRLAFKEAFLKTFGEGWHRITFASAGDKLFLGITAGQVAYWPGDFRFSPGWPPATRAKQWTRARIVDHG